MFGRREVCLLRGRNEGKEMDRGLINGFGVRDQFGWNNFWKVEISQWIQSFNFSQIQPPSKEKVFKGKLPLK